MIEETVKVGLIKEPETLGFVMHLDRNLEDTTTCNVVWGHKSYKDSVNALIENPEILDIQWTNKLFIVSD